MAKCHLILISFQTPPSVQIISLINYPMLFIVMNNLNSKESELGVKTELKSDKDSKRHARNEIGMTRKSHVVSPHPIVNCQE